MDASTFKSSLPQLKFRSLSSLPLNPGLKTRFRVVALPLFLVAIALTLVITGIGCKEGTTHQHPKSSDTAGNPGMPSAETLAMIDSVQRAQAAVDPMKVTVFMSAERAKLLQQRVESTTGLDKVNFMVMWGFEELKAGNTETAIKLFQDVLTMVEPMENPPSGRLSGWPSPCCWSLSWMSRLSCPMITWATSSAT